MQNVYSYNIFDLDKYSSVSCPTGTSEILLDDRHLSKSAVRGLDILEFFASHQRPARAVEVAQALKLSSSSADQLLKTLASHAYLIFDMKTKLYYPSPRLLGFATLLGRAYFGGNRLRVLMQDLLESSGYAVSISTPVARFMQLVDYIAPEGQSYDRLPGQLFPLLGSAAGIAILATWPLQSVHSLIEQSEDQIGPLAADPQTILERLTEVRANGHAFGGLSVDTEKCSIAVSLPRADFGTELSLSVRGPTGELKGKRWRLAAVINETVARYFARAPDCEGAAGAPARLCRNSSHACFKPSPG